MIVGGPVRAAPDGPAGRTNQKTRTRTAIVDACRALVTSGATVTMPEVARAALVSEATAYRYFPDLISLLNAATVGIWPAPSVALEPVSNSPDPIERIGFACEFMLRGVLAMQGAVRAIISATIARPELADARPGIRFGLIGQALEPLEHTMGVTDPKRLAQLKRDLAAVVSADAFFTLTDSAGVPPDEAIASLVRTAMTVTRAAVTEQPRPPRTATRRTGSRTRKIARSEPPAVCPQH
jgi:AcrR family transcriptional regulator